MSFGIVAGEADDRELVHGVHVSSPLLPPVCSRGNRTASGLAPNRDGVLCWRDRRVQVFSGFEKPAGGTDKAERRREPGAWVQAQQVPWTIGLKIAEN